MELTESYPIELSQRQPAIRNKPLVRRTLSPQEEKAKLTKKIEAMMAKNNILKEKQDSLQNTIYDLRKLLEFVGKQSLEECSELHRGNGLLDKKVKGMTQTVELSHRQGNHLQKCAMYWGQFLS